MILSRTSASPRRLLLALALAATALLLAAAVARGGALPPFAAL